MAVETFRAIATKTVIDGEDVVVTHAVEGGRTIRMVYGFAQLAALIMAARNGMPEVEGE
jgi:hypothetical protein